MFIRRNLVRNTIWLLVILVILFFRGPNEDNGRLIPLGVMMALIVALWLGAESVKIDSQRFGCLAVRGGGRRFSRLRPGSYLVIGKKKIADANIEFAHIPKTLNSDCNILVPGCYDIRARAEVSMTRNLAEVLVENALEAKSSDSTTRKMYLAQKKRGGAPRNSSSAIFCAERTFTTNNISREGHWVSVRIW